MRYGYTKQLNIKFEQAVLKTKEGLSKEGFGVLTEIDVSATLKKKLGVEYDNYIILGACNPSLAHQALNAEKEIGLFLPCNVIIYEDGGKVFVSAIMPTAAMGMIKNEELEKIAAEAEAKLKKVIISLYEI